MKKILIFGAIVGMLSSCGSGAYHLTSTEKEAQRGFHAKQAKKIIDTNEKNKAANKKAAEKAKAEQNEHLNALNKNKSKSLRNDRVFKFY